MTAELSGPLPPPEYSLDHEGLHGHLSRLAVLHHVPDDEFSDLDSSAEYFDRSRFENMAGRFVVQTSGHSRIPEYVGVTQDSVQKSHMLQEVHRAIRMEGAHGDRDYPDWLAMSNTLLKRSMDAEGEEKDTCLVSAVACAQFAPDEKSREEFLRIVYSNNMQGDVAKACEASSVVLLMEGPNAPHQVPGKEYEATFVHPIRSYAKTFEIPADDMEKYLYHKIVGPTAIGAVATPKQLQKRVVAEAGNGEVSEDTRKQAVEVSVSGKKVGGVLLDPYKIERFGLQQMFLHDQLTALFPEGVPFERSPFAYELAARRGTDNTLQAQDIQGGRWRGHTIRGVMGSLSADAQSAFKELSGPVVAQYSLEGADIADKQSLSPRQRAALRFRQITTEMGRHVSLAQFMNYEQFVDVMDDEVIPEVSGLSDIWDVSIDGAAAPTSCREALETLLVAAYKDKGKIKPAELELWQLAQQDRRRLLTAATSHIVDFTNSNLLSRTARLERSDKGELELKGKPHVAKDKEDIYAAIALGCPALREQHPDRSELTQEQKLAHGSSNFIDHVLAAMINEAYHRGAFSLENYAAIGIPEHKRSSQHKR